MSGPDVAAHRSLAPDGPDEMGRELAEGPEAVTATLALLDERLAPLHRAIAPATRIVLIGTGASLAVARAVAPEWRRSERSPAERGRMVFVRESTESVFGGLDGATFGPGDAVVAISQSGGSPETLAAATLARELGATVVAVTAHARSALADIAATAVLVPVGEEEGAATKSELATLAALLAVAGTLGSDAIARRALARWLSDIVAAAHDLDRIVDRLGAAGRTWVVGLGPTTGIAHACALLWHEKVHRPAVASTASEFRHGLVESVGPGDAVLVLPPPARSADAEAYLALLAREVAGLGARALVLDPCEMAPVVPDALSASAGLLGTLLRLHQLARGTAHAAGTYVDGFRVLRKVVRPAPPRFG